MVDYIFNTEVDMIECAMWWELPEAGIKGTNTQTNTKYTHVAVLEQAAVKLCVPDSTARPVTQAVTALTALMGSSACAKISAVLWR